MKIRAAVLAIILTAAAAPAALAQGAGYAPSAGVQNMITNLFNNDNTTQYLILMGWIALLGGYLMVMSSMLMFAALGDGRQRGEASLGKAFTTLIVGVLLVCLETFLSTMRKSLGIEKFETINYGTFAGSGWAADALNSMTNLLAFVGVVFVIRSLYSFRQAAHDERGGHIARAIAMMISGVVLTNSGKVINFFGEMMQGAA